MASRRVHRERAKLGGLEYIFCCSGTPEQLEELYQKNYNIRVVEGYQLPPIWVSVESGNLLFALKLLEYESGVVNFENCGISNLPISILAWLVQHSPKELNLSFNKLNCLPVELRHLKKVILTGNPLQSLPAVLHEGKWPKIRRYLDTLASKSANWDVRKLLIVGEEGVGKSTLVRSLKSKSGKADCNYNVATDGIEIREIQVQSDQREISFNTWDLGGQVVYFPTHQFFLSSVSIYIIVFNMINPNIPRVEYWMKQIQEMARNSYCAIILVGTHCDQINIEEINEVVERLKSRFPKQRYPFFQNIIHPVSSKSGSGIRELKQILVKTALQSSLSPVVPVSWVRLYQLLKSVPDYKEYINWKDYESLVTKCEIKLEEIELVTEHLCNTGTIVHFNEPELTDLVILNPQWLTKIMSCLITLKPNFVSSGFIHLSNLTKVFCQYPEDLHNFFISLFQKFKIICPILGSEGQFVVPSLLPNVRPTESILKLLPSTLSDYQNCYGRVFRFSQLPLGLPGRIIVTVLQMASMIGKVFWFNGVTAIYDPDQCDKVTESNINQTINVTTTTTASNIAPQNTTTTPTSPMNPLTLNLAQVTSLPNSSNDYYLLGESPRSSRSSDIENKYSDDVIVHIEYEEHSYQLGVQVRFPTSKSTIALKLWRQLLEAIRVLLLSFYKSLESSMEVFIPCIHCLRKGTYLEKVFLFSFNECDSAYKKNTPFVYCQHIESPSRAVRVAELVPEIFLMDLPNIDESLIQIDQVIGEGSYSKVYSAKLSGKTIAAVKELKLSNPDMEGHQFRQFQSEAYVMSILNHPNIVKFHGILKNPPRLVMEYLPKGDLFGFLHPLNAVGELGTISSDLFPWRNRIKIAYSIAKGLHYLQSITPPVAHLDLRTPNIFLKSDDFAVIGDFGLARLVQGGQIGGTLHTWKWLPPEAIDSNKPVYDQRTDIYSFGIILWELASLSIPFEEFANHPKYSHNKSIKVLEIKSAIIEDNLRPTIPENTPPLFAALIKSCWSKNCADRPLTTDILHQLKQIMNELNIPVEEIEEKIEEEENEDKLNVIFAGQLTPDSNNILDSKIEVSSILPILRWNTDQEITKILFANSNLWITLQSGLILIANFSYESKSFEIIEEIKAHFPKRVSIIFNDAYNKIISSSEDGKIIIWNAKTLKQENIFTPLELTKSKSCFGACMLSVVTINSERLWIGSPIEGKIFLFNVATFQLESSITHDHLIGIKEMVYHKGFVWTLSGKPYTNKIAIYNADTLDFVGVFSASKRSVLSIQSVSGRIWTITKSSINVWESVDTNSITCVKTIQSRQNKLSTMYITKQSKSVLTGGEDGTILKWDSSKFIAIQELDNNECCNSEEDSTIPQSGIKCITEDQNNHLFVVSNNEISIWENSEDFNMSSEDCINVIHSNQKEKDQSLTSSQYEIIENYEVKNTFVYRSASVNTTPRTRTQTLMTSTPSNSQLMGNHRTVKNPDPRRLSRSLSTVPLPDSPPGPRPLPPIPPRKKASADSTFIILYNNFPKPVAMLNKPSSLPSSPKYAPPPKHFNSPIKPTISPPMKQALGSPRNHNNSLKNNDSNVTTDANGTSKQNYPPFHSVDKYKTNQNDSDNNEDEMIEFDNNLSLVAFLQKCKSMNNNQTSFDINITFKSPTKIIISRKI